MRTQSTPSQIYELMASVAAKTMGQQTATGAHSNFKEILSGALKKDAPVRQPANGTQADTSNGKTKAPGIQTKEAATKEGKETTGQSDDKAADDQAAALAAAMMQQPVEAIAALLTGQLEDEIVEGETVAIAQALATQILGVTAQATQQMIPVIADQQTLVLRQAVQEADEAGMDALPQTGQDATPEEMPIISAQVVEQPTRKEMDAAGQSGTSNVPLTTTKDQAAQEKFDSMIAQATEALGNEDVFAPKIHPMEPVAAPEMLRAEIPGESKEKLEQPPLVRAAEKNVKNSVEIENPEESLLANRDLPLQTYEPVEVKPLEKAPEPFRSTPAQQVQAKIVENLENEKMEFRMQLQPQQLGKIDVRMVLESGRLTVEILAASAKTTELLTKQTEVLASSLKLSGIELQTVQVVPSTQGQNNHMEQSLNMMMNQSGNETEQQEQTGRSRSQNEESNRQQAAQAAEAQEKRKPQSLLNYAV